MQLMINSRGVFLSQRNECFSLKKTVDNEVKKKTFSPQRVESIVITNQASITTQALVLAVEHNIDVLLLDCNGEPVGRFWYGRGGRAAQVHRRQLTCAASPAGTALALGWIDQKLANQELFLKNLRRARPGKEEDFAEALDRLAESRQKLAEIGAATPDSPLLIDEIRLSVMGVEGVAARAYFACLSRLLPAEFRFNGRSRRPAKDPFNAALNYAYGILYSRVERACLLAGLDPYIGFLHAEHPYRPALVCDLIEPFRLWAEKVVVHLFTGRKMQRAYFDEEQEGTQLNRAGKEILIPAFLEHLDEKIRYRRRNVPRGALCLHEAHRLANQLLTDEEPPPDWMMELEEF